MSKLSATSYSLANLNAGWVFTPAWSKLSRLGDLIATETNESNMASKGNATSPKELVVVLGWWNSNEMQLRHYTQLYSSLGYDTLTHISPTFQYPSWKSLIKRHVRLLQDFQEFPRQNVVVHALSNNGAFTAAVLHRLSMINKIDDWSGKAVKDLMGIIPKNLPDFPIARMVFDSSPAPLHAQMLTNATLEATERGLDHWSKDTLNSSWNTFLSSTRVVSILDGLLYPSMDMMIPEKALVIGSKSDLVVPWNEVQEWVTFARKRGAKIVEKEFEDSGHVSHLRRYPEEYRKAIQAFLASSQAQADPWKGSRVGQAA
jgi:hypothetical protein